MSEECLYSTELTCRDRLEYALGWMATRADWQNEMADLKSVREDGLKMLGEALGVDDLATITFRGSDIAICAGLVYRAAKKRLDRENGGIY